VLRPEALGLALLIVLWNASALSRDWLDVLAYAFEGFAALLALLMVILFLRQLQLQEVIEIRNKEIQASSEREKDKRRAEEEGASPRRERNRERVSTLLRELDEEVDNVSARKITVTVGGSHLRDDEVMSISLVQALHATALYDPDDSVKACAREMLYSRP
jgi:hypothetical protein